MTINEKYQLPSDEKKLIFEALELVQWKLANLIARDESFDLESGAVGVAALQHLQKASQLINEYIFEHYVHHAELE